MANPPRLTIDDCLEIGKLAGRIAYHHGLTEAHSSRIVDAILAAVRDELGKV